MVNYNFQPRGEKSDFGWHSRGYIPHFDGGEVCQFITIRLYDSVPQKVLDSWKKVAANDTEFRRKVEGYLDSGYGACWLKEEKVATIVENSVRFYDAERYRLISWVIMPNHVHLLMRPMEKEHLSDILHSIKSYTAQDANKLLGRSGQFWQHESFDRYIRNQNHFDNVVEYIEQNPVKAGLCDIASEWRFGSAHFKSGVGY